MPVHYALLKNTCWKNLCRTDLSSKKWLINLDHYSITHGGIDESGRKSWSGMSSTSIIHFIVIIIIIIHCHHHSLSSSSTVIISTFSTALAAFSQSTMRHVRLKSIAFSASRHRLMILTMRRVSLINDCNLISVCVKVCGEWSQSQFERKFWGPENLWQV